MARDGGSGKCTDDRGIEPRIGVMRISIDMIDPLRIERTCPADEAVHLIAFREQKLRQV